MPSTPLPLHGVPSASDEAIPPTSIGRIGQYVLSGLLCLGALILLFLGSFSDSTVTMLSNVVRAPTAQTTEARPTQPALAVRSLSTAALSVKPEQAEVDTEAAQRGLLHEPSVEPQAGGVGQRSDGGSAIHAPRLPAQTARIHRHVREVPIRPYVTKSDPHGIWLSVPNQNSGSNS
jgi:hypothetical protein